MRSFVRARLNDNIVVISGSGNPELSQKVADELGVPLGDFDVEKFADGEDNVQLHQSVRGSDVYVIAPTSYPVDQNIMELQFTIDALRRSDAGRITVVMPYFGYQRKERATTPHDSIAARVVADMIQERGADHIILVDPHATAMQGFFTVPVELISAMKELSSAFKARHPSEELVVVSPDLGGVKRAEKFAQYMGLNPDDNAAVHKRRTGSDRMEVVNVLGNVAGKHTVIVDDLISTGSSMIGAAKALKAAGALSVSIAATHAVFSAPGALQRLEDTPEIDDIYITDTVPLREGTPTVDDHPKVRMVSMAPKLAQAIESVHQGKSLSAQGITLQF